MILAGSLELTTAGRTRTPSDARWRRLSSRRGNWKSRLGFEKVWTHKHRVACCCTRRAGPVHGVATRGLRKHDGQLVKFFAVLAGCGLRVIVVSRCGRAAKFSSWALAAAASSVPSPGCVGTPPGASCALQGWATLQCASSDPEGCAGMPRPPLCADMQGMERLCPPLRPHGSWRQLGRVGGHQAAASSQAPCRTGFKWVQAAAVRPPFRPAHPCRPAAAVADDTTADAFW